MGVARVVLGALAAINVVRGSVHAFAADGGAHSIAGLTLGSEAATIVALFASIGLMQLALGGFELWVVARRATLVLPVLALQTAQTFLGTIHLWWWRPLPVEVPGAAFNLGLCGVLVVTWGVTWMRGRARS